MKKLIGDSTQIMAKYDVYTRDQLVALFDEEIARLPADQQASATFEIDEYGHEYDSTRYHALFMKWQRLETDQEEQKREAQEAAWKEKQRVRDLVEFDRLKKQFGG